MQAVPEATREVQWNVTPGMVGVMYGTMVAALAVFGYGSWRRVRLWRVGQREVRWDRPWQRTRRLLAETLGHVTLLRERVPGFMHALIFFSFLVLFIATVVVFIHHDVGIPIMRGRFYLYFQSLATNIFGALLLVGILIALGRRYVTRVAHLRPGTAFDAALLACLFLIVATGFVISGVRIVVTDDPWGLWRPVGYATGVVTARLVPDTSALLQVHAWTWIGHVVLWHALLALAPFTKLFHVVTGPLSIFFGNLGPRGALPPVDFEDPEAMESLGIRSPFDMTWKQLLDLDACTECGRCEAVCPAWAEGKPLSPKRVIMDLRDEIRDHSSAILGAAAARSRGRIEEYHDAVQALPLLAGATIREETLWACTTCGACEQACPVSIEHVGLILGLRRNLAMEQAIAPEGLVEAVNSLEVRQHPFRGSDVERSAWYRNLHEGPTQPPAKE
jgi:ferredoxin/nitrate reductase gamma subunit